MTGSDMVLILAWAAAIVGPVLTFLLVRRMLSVRRIFLGWTLAGVTAVVWASGVWGFLIEPTTLTVRHVTVESTAWQGPPLRIGVISDTHVSAPHVDVPRVRRLVARMNAERPDIVALLGDYTGGHRGAAERSPEEQAEVLAGIEAFAALDAPLGRYGVLGNHDSWFDEADIAAAMRRGQATVLENRAVRVDRPGGSFWIGGVADLQSRRLQPSVPAALEAVPGDAPVLLLTHWPDPFEDVPPRVALTLAGHTHCGQVNLPLFGRVVLPSPASYRWPCGLYDEGGRKLFVTGGVGVSILPVRFRAPPEIVVVTTRRPSAA